MLGRVDDDEELQAALYARMRWNTPLSRPHAGLLMERLDLRPGLRVADLGCGWGELLLSVVERASSPDLTAPVTGTGVDTSTAALTRARALAVERHLDRQVEFAEADVSAWRGSADRVLCVGASHAFGGTSRALDALTQVTEPGGRLLFGDGFWEAAPSSAATEIFGDEVLTLAGIVAACGAAGWRLIHLSTAGQHEWDDFESTFRAGRQEWLLANPGDPRAPEVRDWLDERERRYFQDYRGVLGFAYLVLAR
jgi:cyclopropane fatty-acyl-phospholipid synthase-like methyltransferase